MGEWVRLRLTEVCWPVSFWMSIGSIWQAVARFFTIVITFVLALFLPLLPSAATSAEIVLRDNIGEGSAATDRVPGGESIRLGANFDTPGVVIPPTSAAGILKEARFVIFARHGSTTGPPVEPDELEFMQFVEYVFHIWTDGVQGDGDTFDTNPIGDSTNGHIKLEVNIDGEGPAVIAALGETGAQDEFGTFLVTIDLRPYAIEVPENQELVMSLVSEDSSAILRISHSRLEPAGVAEDVYQFDGTRDDQRPGFLSTNYQLPRIHYNGFLSMEVSGQSPLPQPATLQISRAENSAIRLHWASLVDHLYTLEAGTSL
ncbi:MAG: hypothetical protein ACI9R3_003597, partial [Verrucomicrobiales bacterium]